MKTKYFLKGDEFVIENYNHAKSFSSFLPGIAGLRGKPLWALYVNRGQCMASFGTNSKEGAIMEFYPANTAYRRTTIEAFRTFIKIKGDKGIYEPFKMNDPNDPKAPLQRMFILPYEFRIEEESARDRLRCEVIYYTIPGEDFPALARILRIENNSSKTKDIEIIDGMPKLCPYGMNEFFAKHMSRTIEAWMEVALLSEKTPFYRLRVDASDVAQTKHITGGNFYLSAIDGHIFARPDIIVDPKIVFGDFQDFTYPAGFDTGAFKVPAVQVDRNITPSAFSYCAISLPKGETASIFSLIGHADSSGKLKDINNNINAKYFYSKRIENKEIIEKLASSVSTSSASREFDLYVRQTNLDNIMRGGFPVNTGKGGKVIYVFNRKHGDLERDYNNFVLPGEFRSQGNGNFRDTNQNRRNSVWLNPSVGTKDIKDFYSLIQLDGYNPLIIKGKVKDSSAGIDAEHGEGFWIDHWTYNLDLVESYLALFPEKREELIFKEKDYAFFDNPHRIRPRRMRIISDKNGKTRQHDSVYLDEEKSELINSRKQDQPWVRTKSGRGKVYKCTLAGKMLSIIINKMATLDPEGSGIEMEADKPAWCDSMNGLPALMGSSLCETLELKRLVRFLLNAGTACPKVSISILAELASFMEGLTKLVSGDASDKAYWDKSNTLKEKYRDDVRFGIDGKEEHIGREELIKFLNLTLKKLERGIKKSKDNSGVPYTYFIKEGRARRALPIFLEGPVHALKIEEDRQKAKLLYNNIKRSELYDKVLKMYRLNASLEKESLEIGRMRAFTPGWLENESVWLHMEYKYLLEVLRAGLYKEFYEEFKNQLIPFQDPERYGRSILENSSFIASSKFFDPALRGAGFVARLSGATAEFLHMLLIMNLGKHPFIVRDSKLYFSPSPALEKALFTDKGYYSFNIFSYTAITYNNPNRKDTFGENCVGVRQYKVRYRNGKVFTINSTQLGEPFSIDLREGKIEKIDALLG